MPSIIEIDRSGVDAVLDKIRLAKKDEARGLNFLKIGLGTVATGMALASGTSFLEIQEPGNQYIFEMKVESLIIALGSIIAIAGTRTANDARAEIDRMTAGLSQNNIGSSPPDRPASVSRANQGWRYARSALPKKVK